LQVKLCKNTSFDCKRNLKSVYVKKKVRYFSKKRDFEMKKYIFLAILLTIVGAVVWVMTSYETIVKNIVHKYGSQIVGTDVSIKGLDIALFDGEASVKEIVVANPKGYKTPHFISLGGISVKVDTNSILSDTIVIESIVVEKPSLSYEIISLTQNNVKEIQNNITKNTASTDQVEKKDVKEVTETPKKESASKKVVIKHLQIKSGEIIAAMPGGDVTVPLPDVDMRNIGAAKEGESVSKVITTIMNRILSTASKAITSSKLTDLKNVAEENLNSVVGDVKDRVKKLGIFGK